MRAFLDILAGPEGQILLFVQEHLRIEALTPIMKTISLSGTAGAIWIILSIILLFSKKTRRAGILSLVSLAITFCIVNLYLKDAVARIRPYDMLPALQILVGPENDLSFPSGHASSAFASAVVLKKCSKTFFGPLVLLYAFLMAISRIYVGVHYPSDVIAGALIGAVVALVVFWVFGERSAKRRERRRKRRKHRN